MKRVTTAFFPGNDFAQSSAPAYTIAMDSEQEMNNNVWLVYLRRSGVVHQVPGYVLNFDDCYRVDRYYDDGDGQVVTIIYTEQGVGESFSAVEIVRIGISTFIDSTAAVPASEQSPPFETDYESIADRFGF